MLSQLPNEVLLHVIYMARSETQADWGILQSVPLISKMFSILMRKYRRDIIDYYTIITERGTAIVHLFGGKIHRFSDLPAIEYKSGRKEWYWLGRLHRGDDKPAIIQSNGTQEWYRHGLQHRDNDKSAVIWANKGPREWYWYGKRHRITGPAIIWANETTSCYRHGKYIGSA